MAPARISFYAGVNPLSIKNITVPLKILSWQWTADGGGSGQTVPCAQPINPCIATVMESGTMQLTALANGEEQTASASVGIWPLAAPCPAAVLPNHPATTDEYGVVDPGIHDDPHTGRDVHATDGTAFKSARDGIVVQRDSTKSGGLRLIVRATDGSNRLSYYYHLQDTELPPV
jgi:murein DD-endopeptidase MepM/ murein hydrolase activator NlpD